MDKEGRNLIAELNQDGALEPFFKTKDQLRFYCAGGRFLDITKTGKLHKHDYDNYFSKDHAKEKESFLAAKDAERLLEIYSEKEGAVYAASKAALLNRALSSQHSEETNGKAKVYLERLYQQTIAYNNRPGEERSCGVADFSFGVSSTYLRNGKSRGATFVDLVWVDEANTEIAFIEYKQGTGALDGKSGLLDHCAKTFLSMDNENVKALALTRYFAKKAFHGGNLDCRASDFQKQAAQAAEGYTGFCAFMFTDIPAKELEQCALLPLRRGADKINKIIREINPSTDIKVDLNRIRYAYHEDYNKICLKRESFLPL